MKLLKDKIINQGKVFPGNILKVDCFLNHQIDPNLMFEMGKEFDNYFANKNITKVVTIESSGIALAIMTAYIMQVPMVFAKKCQTKNLSDDVYCTQVMSFTHGKVYDVKIAKEFINKNDRVLIVDDFLANGVAIEGLIKLVQFAGAEVVGAGVAIEKGFQCGGQKLRDSGIDLKSLAIIQSMQNGIVSFRQ